MALDTATDPATFAARVNAWLAKHGHALCTPADLIGVEGLRTSYATPAYAGRDVLKCRKEDAYLASIGLAA